MKKVIALLLLVSSLLSVAPSFAATDWKVKEAERIAEQNRRRAEDLQRAKSEQEARDKLRRMQYEEQRRQDLERKIRYQQKYGK